MEPILRKVMIKKCASKEEANRELVKGLLGNESMSFQLVVTILTSEPYSLSTREVNVALNEVNKEGLLKIDKFIMKEWLCLSGHDIVLALVR